MSYLFLGFFLLLASPSWALVTCAPTSCVPACDSSCTYQVCGGSATKSFLIKELPYSYASEFDACQDPLDGQVIKQIPTPQLPGVNQIPANTSRPYLRCQTLVNTGPPCPP